MAKAGGETKGRHSAPARQAAPRKRGGGFVGFLLLLALLAGAGALGWQEAERLVYGPGPTAKEGAVTIVMIPKGAGAARIAAILADAGVIRSAPAFRIAARLLRDDYRFKAGEYRVQSGESAKSIMDRLAKGDVVTYSITLPEGLSAVQIADKLSAEPALTGEITTLPDEGSLLPDTYYFARGDSRESLIRQMQAAESKFAEAEWARRAPDLPFTTLADAITLASIVEKETGRAEERPLVASVFVNRLRKGMRLESDPTIIYGITNGRPLGRGIRQSELEAKTAYNTYQIAGLPPSPIANPSRAAIRAVLNPPATDYLFFVANGEGGHAFSADLAEHQANVRKLRALEADAAQTPSGPQADPPAAPQADRQDPGRQNPVKPNSGAKNSGKAGHARPAASKPHPRR